MGYFELQANIEQRIDRGESLRKVEEDIARFPIPKKDRDELSTWAWAWRESSKQRRLERVKQTVVLMTPFIIGVFLFVHLI